MWQLGRRLRGVAAGCGVFVLAVAAEVHANGQAEYVAPIDRPVSAIPGRPLPYPVAEEAMARGVPSALLEALPEQLGLLSTPALSSGVAYDNALGEKKRCFESIVLRGSALAPGKLTISAGGLAYVTENARGAAPFRQDALCFAGVPHTLIDVEQTIVTRKGVTLSVADPVALGSELYRLRAITEVGDARSAVVEVTALTGFDWARLGTGSLELSTTQPGWHAKTFHYGLHQGRVEQVGPKDVRLAWLSALRTDDVVLAQKRELAGKLGPGAEAALGGGARLRVSRVDGGARQLELETPDGKRTLSAAGDLRGLPADASARKRLIAVGTTFAVVLVPEASDFAARQAHVEGYSGLARYRHGEVPADAAGYRVYAHAHYTGALFGLSFVNEQPLELSPANSTIVGPKGAFKLVSRWNARGELEALVLEDYRAGRAELSAAGRRSLEFLAGAGPTIESLAARSGLALPAASVARDSGSSGGPRAAPSAAPPAAGTAAVLSDPVNVAAIRPALFWICAAAMLGLLIGFGLGRAR